MHIFLVSGCKQNNTELNGYSHEDIEEIIQTFLVSNIQTEFDEDDTVAYSDIFNYYLYYGFFDLDGNIRPELKEYSSDDDFYNSTFSIPRKMVDNFLLSKFNTEVDSSVIDVYDKQNDMYIIAPLVGDYYFDIEITKTKHKTDDIFEIFISQENSITEEDAIDHRFEIELLSDFKFIAHEILESENNNDNLRWLPEESL